MANGDMVVVSEAIKKQIKDALSLLEYAVESGRKREPEEVLEERIVVGIKTTAAKAAIHGSTLAPSSEPTVIASADWIAFEMAYHDLALFMYPVTAQSLEDTRLMGSWFKGERSVAQQFTNTLWMWTISFALFAVFGECWERAYGPVIEGSVDWRDIATSLIQILVPYMYGGLGACAYLLRSAHQHIHERSFDLRRKPEYLNRILLGMVSGGAIILFVEHVVTDDGATITLSSAALGFVAGYSTDFLFNTIERVVGALLPKVGLESIRRQSDRVPKRPSDVDMSGAGMKEMMDRLAAATEEADKALYRSIIERMRERI